MKKCPYCGAEYPDDIKACSVDHEQLLDWSARSRLSRLTRKFEEKKKQGIRPSIQILMALIILAIGSCGLWFAFSGIVDGKVYLPSRQRTLQVARETHPHIFWGCIVFWATVGAGITGLGCQNIREACRAIKKRHQSTH
jgi:hypothetical protein